MKPGPKRLNRRKRVLDTRNRIVVFTEGEVTEPAYLRALNKIVTGVNLELGRKTGVPRTLLRYAKETILADRRKSDRAAKSDQYWIVFDKDEHPDVEAVIEEARQSGILVGFSNPCFEVWLILHSRDFDACLGRGDVQEVAKSDCAGYSKKRRLANFELLLEDVEKAEQRAALMREKRKDEGSPLGNPYTSVDLLSRTIAGRQ